MLEEYICTITLICRLSSAFFDSQQQASGLPMFRKRGADTASCLYAIELCTGGGSQSVPLS
jgi:hypothetical protein